MATIAPSRLYEKLAATVRAQIEECTFRPGDRLPSVRELSRSSNVSVSTVLDAYRLLEDQGLVRPRPQSGYYVRAMLGARPPEPAITAPKSPNAVFDRSEILDVMADARNEFIAAMGRSMGRSDVVQLGFGVPQPDLLPHERLARLTCRVVRDHPEACHSYGTVTGVRALREQVAQRAFSAGASVSPDEIVITNGCQEAICLAMRTAVEPGGIVAVESPCHWGILQAIEACGFRGLEIPTSSRTGICLDSLLDAIRDGRERGDPIQACIVSPNFQNPLGFLMPDDKKQALVDLARGEDIALIEDDIYGDLGFEVERPRVLRSFVGGEDVMLCSSFSKTLAPGFRVGWCIAGRRYAKLRRLKHALSASAPTLTQLVIAEFLSNGGYEKFLRRARKAYAATSGLVLDAVARRFPAGTKISQPQGGFVLWVEMPNGADSGAVYSQALAKRILVTPGKLFSVQGAYCSCLRLSTGHWSPRTADAIATVGELAGRATGGL